MMKLGLGTPPAVAEWLESVNKPHRFVVPPRSVRARRSAPQPAVIKRRPDDPAAKALLTDERMENLWKMIGDWPGALDLIQMAVHYSNPFLLSKLTKPPELRTGFGYDAYHLAITAIDFLVALEFFPNTAAGLSGENMGDHVEWLCGFAAAALRSAEEHRALYDFLAAPDGRGRGDRHQLLFRGAIGAVLPRLIELRGGGFTIEQKDEIVAILASVLFPEHEVDLATVGRHRQRKLRKRQRTTT